MIDLISHHQARKRKREEDDIHEYEGKRRTYLSIPPTMSSVETYAFVRSKGSNSLASTSAAYLVSDSAGYTELDDVTAKDSVLKNPDLTAKIFSHLQVDIDERHRYLFNAALTCKDFLDVALDALWEELHSLMPLLKLLPALQLEDNAYVLSGNVSQADLDRLQYYSRKVKVFMAVYPDTDKPQVHPSTYIRIAQLQSSALFPSLRHLYYTLCDSSISHIFLFLSPLLDSLEFSNIRGFENTIVGPFLANLSSQMLSRIVLYTGRMSVDIFKNSIVHFQQLRSLELLDAVFMPMSDSDLWEVLGTLPSLENLTLNSFDPASHPVHVPGNSNSQSGGPKYFEVLKSVSVTGSSFLIQNLLGFIDSPCLKSINVCPVTNHIRFDHDHEPEDRFTPSVMIVASKWSKSLKNLVIQACASGAGRYYAISKCLMLLTDLHEMETFCLNGWRMENMDDDVRRLVMSWPKLKTLRLPLNQAFISLSTLKIIAENCPELRYLRIPLDTSTIPPFDTSSKSLSLRNNLEVLTGVALVTSHSSQSKQECRIQVARYLDSIFPYLKSIEVTVEHNNATNNVAWSGICDLIKLCQDIRRVK